MTSSNSLNSYRFVFSFMICSVLRKRKPAFEALIIARSLWLSPAAIVSNPADCRALTVVS